MVGKGIGIYECKNKKIAVMNLIGRTDMHVLSENPFTVAQELLDEKQQYYLEHIHMFKQQMRILQIKGWDI